MPETTVERTSDRELTVTRTFAAPAARVFAAWTQPELLKRWWCPKSMGVTFVSCEIDARTGGTYRFVFSHPSAEQPMAFFGRYLDVIPPHQLIWTNEEGGDAGPVTTATFQEQGGQTRLVLHDRYPRKKSSTRRWRPTAQAASTSSSNNWTSYSPPALTAAKRKAASSPRLPAKRGPTSRFCSGSATPRTPRCAATSSNRAWKC